MRKGDKCSKCGKGSLITYHLTVERTDLVVKRRRKKCENCGYRAISFEIELDEDMEVSLKLSSHETAIPVVKVNK